MTNGVKSWSYSALSLYEQCPLKYKLEKIDKIKVPTPPAFKRGREVHTEAEKFITGQVEAMPKSLMNFDTMFHDLKSLDPYAELECTFTRKWGTDTNWRDWKRCWLRGKLDACVVYPDGEADVIDFKTGKPRGEYTDQLRLFALMVFLKFPQVKNVKTRLWFLDTGDEEPDEPKVYNRSVVTKEKLYWEKRVGPLFADTVFAPRPNKFCGWCHFRRSNGGVCKHG